MRNVLFATSIVVGLFAANMSYADTPPRPTQCPSVNVLKNYRFPIVQQKSNNTYSLATYPDLFGTDYKYNWILTTEVKVKKQSPQAFAYDGLQTLVYMTGPNLVDGKWTCNYVNADEQFYTAISPII